LIYDAVKGEDYEYTYISYLRKYLTDDDFMDIAKLSKYLTSADFNYVHESITTLLISFVNVYNVLGNYYYY